jgi:hypothetical protein
MQVVELDETALAKAGLGDYSLVTEFGRSVLPVPDADLDTTWEGPIHHFLTKHAQSRPDLPAISYNNQVVTYKQLGASSAAHCPLGTIYSDVVLT